MRMLETERLILRPFTLADAADLHREIYSDIHVVQYYSGKGVMTLAQTQQYLLQRRLGYRIEDSLNGPGYVTILDNGLIAPPITERS